MGFRGALELGALAMPQAGTYDGFLTARPVLAITGGDFFSIELGPTLRFRLIDTPPGQRANDLGGVLRREDWNELSDFGQVLQSLRIGTDATFMAFRAGVMTTKTLGLGHLLNRYSNQENPDYHPAAANLWATLGPFRGEAFASDVLGARLFAGELAWDLGRTFSSNDATFDRYVIAFEVAHDAARAGNPSGVTPARLTLVQLDGSAVVIKNKQVRLMVLAGVGSRGDATADLGLLVGGAVDLSFVGFDFSAKLEARKQAGGFRQGFFGPAYELSRFAGTGFSGLPLADERLPDAFSFSAELRAQFAKLVSAVVMAEYFTFGRTDLDGSVDVTVLKDWVVANARVTIVGLGVLPRFAVSAGARVRLFASLYLLAAGGTVFFPQGDGSLQRGVMGTVGVGVDFAR